MALYGAEHAAVHLNMRCASERPASIPVETQAGKYWSQVSPVWQASSHPTLAEQGESSLGQGREP